MGSPGTADLHLPRCCCASTGLSFSSCSCELLVLPEVVVVPRGFLISCGIRAF